MEAPSREMGGIIRGQAIIQESHPRDSCRGLYAPTILTPRTATQNRDYTLNININR
jgi:hypothetical protein